MSRSETDNAWIAAAIAATATLAAAALTFWLEERTSVGVTTLPFAMAIVATAFAFGARATLGVTLAAVLALAAMAAIDARPGGRGLAAASAWGRVALLGALGLLTACGASLAERRRRRDASALAGHTSPPPPPPAARPQSAVEAGLYRLAVEQSREHATFRLDADGRIATWNEEVGRVLGWPADQWLGRPMANAFAPLVDGDDAAAIVADDLRRAAALGTFAVDRRHATRAGDPFWANVTMTALVDRAGRPAAGFVVVVRDLTGGPIDLSSASSRGHRGAAADGFEFVAQALPVLIAYVDRDERYQFHNAGYATWFPEAFAAAAASDDAPADAAGATRGMPMRGRTIRETVGERMHERLRPYLAAAMAGERTRNEQRIAVAGQGQRDIASTYTPDVSRNGTVLGVAIFAEDVTRRRVVERRSREILESIADGFYSLDTEWRFTYVNARASAHLRRDVADLLGRSIYELFGDSIVSSTRAAFERAVARQEPETFEVRSVVTGRWVEVRAYPSVDGLSVYFHDIDERRQAQAANARLAEIVRGSSDAIVGISPDDGRITSWNPAAEAMFGYAAAEAIGMSADALAAEDRRAERRMIRESALASPLAAQTVETVRLRKDGTRIDVSVSVVAIRDEAGELVAFSATLRDLTERIRRERNLQFLVELNQSIVALDDDPDAIVDVVMRRLREHLRADRCAYSDVDAGGETFRVAGESGVAGVPGMRGLHRFADFEPAVLEHMRADEPDVVDDVGGGGGGGGGRAVVDDAFRATQIRAYVTAPLHKDGRLVAMVSVHQRVPRRWTREDVELVRIVADRCWAAIERARASRASRARELQFRWIAETAPVLIWLGDAAGARTWFSKRWADFTGRGEGQDVGDRWLDAVHPDDRERVRTAVAGATAGGLGFEVDYRLRRADGTHRWMLDRGTPVAAFSSTVATPASGGYMGSCLDITVRKEGEQSQGRALDAERHARGEAERAGRLKDEFLATLGHELRTPLNAILGWAQILLRPNRPPEDVSRGLETIARNARAQAQIINDLLDMSRIVSGKVRLELADVSIADLVVAAVEGVRPAAQAKRVALDVRISPPAAAAFVRADPTRLQQVFWNLLTNAVKFTPEAGVVGVAIDLDASGVRVDVVDSGIGIEPAFAPHVFERFRQADGSTTRQHGGLGLGLSIVKSLVELHGGRVAAHSDGANRGATFTVTLPPARDAAATPDPGEPSDDAAFVVPDAPPPAALSATERRLVGRRILVVDDEPDVLEIVGRVLEEHGALVACAADALRALALIEAEAFDAIVSDIGMPELDGYDLIRRVRERPAAKGGATPAIALTAFARAEDRARALDAGYQRHVAKPVEPDDLVIACDEVLRGATAAS